MISFLKVFNRTFLKDIVFLGVLIFYVWGPLAYFSSFIHVAWSLPTIFILAGVVWGFIEDHLSTECVDPKKKAVFVSGCDTGFGHELVKKLSSEGFIVYAGCFLSDGEGAKRLSAMKSVKIVECDVTKDESMIKAMEFVQRDLSADHVLWGIVANAGVAIMGPLEWSSMDDIRNLFDVNVLGVIRTAKTFLPLLRKTGEGRIVVTSSLSADCSWPMLVPYSMSKAAVTNFATGLRRELRNHTNIFVCAVQPTFYRTPILKELSYEKMEQRYRALPEDLRKTVPDDYLKICETNHAFTHTIAIPDIAEPVECLAHALMSTRPRPNYRPDRPLMKLIFHRMLDHFPVETIDFLLYKSKFVLRLLKSIFSLD